MPEPKTRRTEATIDEFLAGIEGERRRKDCKALVAARKRSIKTPPKTWGAGIVGIRSYHCRYASGQEGTGLWPGIRRASRP